MQWFEERGLTKEVEQTVDSEMTAKIRGLDIGDPYTVTEVTTYYSAGRIDIYGVPGEHYPLEYGVAPMHGEDWNILSDWLNDFETETLIEKAELFEKFEKETGVKIRWADDVWYKCYECGLVTDLRETKDHIHKIDCTRKWDD